MRNNIKTISLSLLVMALWGSLFPFIKIGYSAFNINASSIPDILMFASVRFILSGRVLPYTDTFLYDIKAIEEDVHIKCTGQPNKQILENLKYIDSQNKAIEVRIPYVPNFNDDQIDKIAEFLKLIKNIKAVKVLPYHNYAVSKYKALEMKDTMPDILPSSEEVELLQNNFIYY